MRTKNLMANAFNIIALLYEKLFHEQMSIGATSFFRDLSYVGSGAILGVALSFVFNILVGRTLGTHDYGVFTLIQSIAMFAYVPMIMGLPTAMVKYNSEKNEFARQKEIISTTYGLTFIFMALSVLIYYIFIDSISTVFSTSKEVVSLSIIFAIVFVFYTVTTSTYQGLLQMKEYALSHPLYSVILLFSLFLFSFFGNLSYKTAVFCLYLANFISGVLILILVRRYLRLGFNKYWARKLTKYGIFTTIAGLSFIVLTNIDKIFINYYLDLDSIGIYQAYMFSTTGILSALVNPFNMVFFPACSKGDKKVIWQNLKKFLFILPLLVLSTILLSYAVIRYGYNYPVSWKLVLLFSFMRCTYIPGVSILGCFVSSFGSRGAKQGGINLFLSIPLLIISLYLLVPMYGITGAAISVTVASIIVLALNLLTIKRLLHESK